MARGGLTLMVKSPFFVPPTSKPNYIQKSTSILLDVSTLSSKNLDSYSQAKKIVATAYNLTSNDLMSDKKKGCNLW